MVNFIWKLVSCIIIPNVVFVVLFHKREEFVYLKEKVKNIIRNLIKREKR